MTSDLEKVLEGVQPDILGIEQQRLQVPYCDNLQIQVQESALAILKGKPHVIVCIKSPEKPEKDFILVSYDFTGGVYNIGSEVFLTPDQVLLLKKRNILPHTPGL